MKETLELLQHFLPIEIAIIAAIFIYLLILFKGLAERFISIADKQTKLAETQAQYIQQRLEAVEKYLGISDKAIDLRDKHIKKLEELATRTEEELDQSQKALTKAKEELTATVATLDLQSQEVKGLQEALHNLEQASRAEVMARTVHELQTRLQTIIALSENLMSEVGTVSSEDAYKMTSEVLYASLALDTTVMSLSQDMTEYNFRRRPIENLLDEAKRIYQAQANARGIDILIELAPLNGASPILEISRNHLQLAFNNLIHNAIKYSFHGPPEGKHRFVSIRGKPDGKYYSLTFGNYGVGILPDEIFKIFEDSYRGKLTKGEYRTGSGKGLHFVKRVVDQHNGRIDVQSRPMLNSERPEGQPHLNQFVLYLPYEQPKTD